MEDEQWVVLRYPLPKDALRLISLVVNYPNPVYNYYFPKDLVGK